LIHSVPQGRPKEDRNKVKLLKKLDFASVAKHAKAIFEADYLMDPHWRIMNNIYEVKLFLSATTIAFKGSGV
jgi:hypothetical protein